MGCMFARTIKLKGHYKAVLGCAYEIIKSCSAAVADVQFVKIRCNSDGSFWIVFLNSERNCVAYTHEFKIDYNRRLELLYNAVRNCLSSDIWDAYPGSACPLTNEDKQAINDFINNVVCTCYKTMIFNGCELEAK